MLSRQLNLLAYRWSKMTAAVTLRWGLLRKVAALLSVPQLNRPAERELQATPFSGLSQPTVKFGDINGPGIPLGKFRVIG